METSGDGLANVILYLVVLALFFQVAVRLLLASRSPRRVPVMASILTLLVGVPSLLQFVWPAIYESLHRDPALIVDQAQWWRVFTSVAAQDGGLTAAVFNLIVVAAVTVLAEWIWGRWHTLALFLGCSVVVNLLAVAWNSPGGGSSFASDGLLMSVCGLALVISRRPIVLACVIAAILVGVVLVALNDGHGVAMLLGAIAGAVLGVVEGRGSRPPVVSRPSLRSASTTGR